MTVHSELNITCTTRLVLASIFLAAAWVSAAGQNTNLFPGSGNAGIGTTSPGDALQIVKDNGGLTLDTATSGTIVPVFRFSTTGTGRASIQYRPDLPGLAFQTGGIAYPAQSRMVLTDSGNFGIGTTNPAVKLHSQLSSPNTGTPTGSDMGMFINNSNTTANNYALIGFGNALPQFQAAIGSINLASGANAGGHLVFHTRPTAGATAERMRIDSSGKVGIGTTAPGGKLHIYDLTAGVELIGRIQHADDSSASSNSIWRVISGDLATSKLEFTSSSFWRAAIWSGANKDLQFYTGGPASAATERMRILDTGTIGIGLSNPNPSYKLDVNGAINATALNVNGSPIINTQWANGSGNINYTSGNVGIGTSNPQRTLDLGTSGQLTFGNSGYSSTASPGFFWAADNVNYGIYKSAGSWSAPNYQQLTVNFQTGIVIDGGSAYGKSGTVLQPNGGNVGIGTNAPTEKLEINGNLKLSGTGNLNATGTIEAGNIKAKYQDLAEWVPSSEQLAAGTVVVLDTTKSNQVIASAQAYDTRVAGVISAQPGITLGEGGEGKVLVATTGRVRMKVDASRGAIQIGDLLVTSDIAGVAMKSDAVNLGGVQIHRPGTIIGKALEPLAKGKGEILVLLSLQ
ncbi:MAG TPA: hypothetical protein VFX97_06560 [Pyrinomonadaceae bacterium]|nr:hypothetical protein [Pyrinomonadaceae bacterium]